MSRPRTPTPLLVLKGGLKHDPGRYADRATEPASNGPIGNAPLAFNKARKAIWDEVIDLVPHGVLQKSDRIIIELISRLIYDLRTGESTTAGIAQLRQALASIGMTPADRSRVSAKESPQQDEWSGFAIK